MKKEDIEPVDKDLNVTYHQVLIKDSKQILSQYYPDLKNTLIISS